MHELVKQPTISSERNWDGWAESKLKVGMCKIYLALVICIIYCCFCPTMLYEVSQQLLMKSFSRLWMWTLPTKTSLCYLIEVIVESSTYLPHWKAPGNRMICCVTKPSPRYLSTVTLYEGLSDRMELCPDIQRNVLMLDVLQLTGFNRYIFFL